MGCSEEAEEGQGEVVNRNGNPGSLHMRGKVASSMCVQCVRQWARQWWGGEEVCLEGQC